jgi:hypothetical protein
MASSTIHTRVLAHLLQVAGPSPASRRADDHLAEPGDVDGHVPDAFQVQVDVEDGGEQAQVGGDLVVSGDHRAAQGDVAGHQPARGPGQGGLDQGALGLDVGLQALEGVVEAVSVRSDGQIGMHDGPPRRAGG